MKQLRTHCYPRERIRVISPQDVFPKPIIGRINEKVIKMIRKRPTLFAVEPLQEGPASEVTGGIDATLAGGEVLLAASPSTVIALVN